MKESDRKKLIPFLVVLSIILFSGSKSLLMIIIVVAVFLNWKKIQYYLQKQGIQTPAGPQIDPQIVIEKNKQYFSNLKKMVPRPKRKTLVLIPVVLGLLWLISASYIIVTHGTVGVVTRFGRVTGATFEPGLHFMIPFVDDAVVYNTKKVIYETSDTPLSSSADYTDYAVDTTTKDGQQIQVRYSVRFSVDPTKVTWIANNLGDEKEIVEKVVKTDSRIYTRNIPKQYPASDLYTGNVEDVIAVIAEKLTPIFEENGLILDEFGIRSISFTPEYVDAIESKQIEAEMVITEQNKAEQEKYKKEASITKAQGEAEAQRLQQQTLSNELLQKMWIDKWDGQLPTYQGSGTPLIQLPQ